MNPPALKKEAMMGWSTKDEKKFIDGIGQDRTALVANRPIDSPHVFNFGRKILLKKYLACCEKRVNWGKIDKATVIEYARMG